MTLKHEYENKIYELYEGHWKNDKKNGHGRQIYVDKGHYIGDFAGG